MILLLYKNNILLYAVKLLIGFGPFVVEGRPQSPWNNWPPSSYWIPFFDQSWLLSVLIGIREVYFVQNIGLLICRQLIIIFLNVAQQWDQEM